MDKCETESDWIWGAKAIGAEVGLKERQAFYLLAAGQLPARQVGSKYVASRETLRTLLAQTVLR